MWDDSWTPQALSWLGIVLLPPLAYYSVCDFWASVQFKIIDELDNASYTLAELFNRSIYDHPAQASKAGAGTYYIPYFGILVGVLVAQGVIM